MPKSVIYRPRAKFSSSMHTTNTVSVEPITVLILHSLVSPISISSVSGAEKAIGRGRQARAKRIALTAG